MCPSLLRKDHQTRLVIGICTQQRDVLLRRLLNSILEQPAPREYTVHIIIIDNNTVPMNAKTLQGLPTRFDIKSIHEPNPGLVFARNRALQEAITADADWFIGVDDDEWVEKDWLAQIIAGIESQASLIQIGHCAFVYDDRLSPFLPPIQRPTAPAGMPPIIQATSNFVMHRSVFDPDVGYGMDFDPNFNESGGEDLEFFMRAKHQFGVAATSLPDAIAYENWNGVRATLPYRLKRAMRTQIAFYRIAKVHRKKGLDGNRLRNTQHIVLVTNRQLIYGLGYLVGGLGMLPFRRQTGQRMIGHALLRWARAAAVVPFVMGTTTLAYGPRAPHETIPRLNPK